MSELFKVPAIITKILTMRDKGLRLYVDTQELSSEQIADLFSMNDKFGWFVFGAGKDKITSLALPELPKQPGKKSLSQQLRAVIFRHWELLPKPPAPKNFENFYQSEMANKIDYHINEIQERS